MPGLPRWTQAGRVALALLGIFALVGSPTWAEQTTQRRHERTRIPHLDGSGRATVVEIDPEIPGAKAFLREDPPRIPGRGEVQRAPRAPELPRRPRGE